MTLGDGGSTCTSAGNPVRSSSSVDHGRRRHDDEVAAVLLQAGEDPAVDAKGDRSEKPAGWAFEGSSAGGASAPGDPARGLRSWAVAACKSGTEHSGASSSNLPKVGWSRPTGSLGRLRMPASSRRSATPLAGSGMGVEEALPGSGAATPRRNGRPYPSRRTTARWSSRRGSLPGEGAGDRASDPDLVGRHISSPRVERKELLVIDGHDILASDTWGCEAGRCPRGR